MKAGEQVLVFPTRLLGQSPFQGVLTGDEALSLLATVLAPANLHYRDREEAEQNPEYKQLIPYTVIRAGVHFLRYQRTKKGGESRLHNLWSVGVGGHINPQDGQGGVEAYHAAFQRELLEEISLTTNFTERIIGVLNDDSNSVGQVHFGVIHLVDLPEKGDILSLDPSLRMIVFSTLQSLQRDVGVFENWSQLVIREALPKISG